MGANPTKMLENVITEVLATFGLMPSPTKIHNKSGMTIFLIPIFYFRDDKPLPTGQTEEELALSTGKIEKELAIEIKEKSVASVCWWRYSPSCRSFPSNTKIIFLARKNDHLQKILEELTNSPDKVSELLKETIRDHTVLCEKRGTREKLDLYLKLQGDKVHVGIGDQDKKETGKEQAEPPSESAIKKTQTLSTQKLTEEVEELKKGVQALNFQMSTLVKNFEKLLPGLNRA